MAMLEFGWRVVSTLGGAAAILLTLVGVAYWIFRTFSERWLQSKFDARLEGLRHAQAREIEQLKFRINALMDRATKLHEREYQTLPELWEALATAWSETSAFISPFQSVADASRMSDAQLEEHLAGTHLSESQKQKVRDSTNRTKSLQDESYWHRKSDVHDIARNFTRTLRFSGIFVPDEIKGPMKTAEDLIWNVLVEHTYNEENSPRPLQRLAHKKFSTEGKDLLDKIEKLVHERLWSITKLD